MIVIITSSSGDFSTDILLQIFEQREVKASRLHIDTLLEDIGLLDLKNFRKKISNYFGSEKLLFLYRRNMQPQLGEYLDRNFSLSFNVNIWEFLNSEINALESWFVDQLGKYWPVIGGLYGYNDA